MLRISFPTYIRLVDCCREDALMSVLSNPKDSTKSLIYYLRLMQLNRAMHGFSFHKKVSLPRQKTVLLK